MRESFQTNPWPLDHLLESMDKGQIVVPEFQRSFVWNPIDTFDLIVSIANRYPAGSILFIRQGKDYTLAYRLAEGVNENNKNFLSPEQLILDGQQRLTSLYQALYGKGKHRFFLSLKSLKNGESFEDAAFYENLRGAKKYATPQQQFENEILPLSCIFNKEINFDRWMFEFIEYKEQKQPGQRKELTTWLTQIRDTFLKPIQEYRFPVVELTPETKLDAICKIFESLNLKGVKLTVFEILTAKLWPTGTKLRELWQKARDDFPLVSQFIDEDESVYVLKTIALSKTKDPNVKTLSCKRADLLELTPTDISKYWDLAIKFLDKSLAILKNEYGVLSRKWLPYVTILSPMATALALIESNLTGIEEGKARKKIERWLWCSIFSQRYDSATDSKSVQDVLELKRWLEGGDEPEVVRTFKFDSAELRGITIQSSAIYRGLICLIVRAGAIDFHRQTKISTLDLVREGIEDHHVFPSGYLQTRGIKSDLPDSILNKTLIDAETNKRIGKKAPSEYLGEIEKGIGNAKLKEILKSHKLIESDDSPLIKDEFELFLKEREAKFAELVKSVASQD